MSGDYQLEDTVYIPFTTRQFSDGVPTALVSGEVQIYEDASITQITGAETLTVSLDGIAGFNMVQVAMTGANGFGAGQSYTLVLSAGTVGGTSVIGEVVGHFTIEMSAAALDLANGTDGLGAIKAETALIVADTGELQTNQSNWLTATGFATSAALTTAQNDLDIITDSDGVILGAAGVDLIWDEALAGHVGADSTGLVLNDWQDAGRLDTILDTIAADAVLIKADTNELQTNQGNWITATGFATSAALTTAQNDLDIITGTDGVTLATAQALYAPAKAGDSMALTAAGVDAIWDEDIVAAHTTADTAGFKLAAAGGAADPWSTALPGAYGAGTAGEILGDWKNGERLDLLLDAIPTTAMRGTDDAATAANLALAQTDLDTLTAGVTLADGAHGGSAAVLTLDHIVISSSTEPGISITTTGLGDHGITIAANNATGVGLLAYGELSGFVAANVGAGSGPAFAISANGSGTGLEITSATGTPATGVTVDVTEISGSAPAADNLEASALGIIPGVAATGTLSTTVMTSDLTGYVNDELIGRVVVWTGGTAKGQASDITDYASASGTVTYTAITTAPANADTFVII